MTDVPAFAELGDFSVYNLTAERDGDVIPHKTVETAQEAARYVELLTDRGEWPAGYDAVITAPDGGRFRLDHVDARGHSWETLN